MAILKAFRKVKPGAMHNGRTVTRIEVSTKDQFYLKDSYNDVVSILTPTDDFFHADTMWLTNNMLY